ncbi:MAG: methyltransferase domain-containing protein [Nostocaceae cyanobacterium]|nr:methyltransferase domain-containing protein [Nostocaceae cyanobacterium]
MLENSDINQYKQQLLADFNFRTNYDQGKFYSPVAQCLISCANLQTRQKILDVATGTGLVAFAAAQIVGDSGKVIAVDISPGMLSQAREKLAASGLQNLAFLEADAEHIHLVESSFDRILCSLAICYLTDISGALKQWYFWLTPGGMVAFNAWDENAFIPSVLFREVAANYGITVPNPNATLGTHKRCEKLLQAEGFTDIQIQNQQFGWYFIPDVNYAEELWKINSRNVFGYQVLQLSPEKLEECKAEYIAAIQALPKTEQGVWCDALAFFITAKRREN